MSFSLINLSITPSSSVKFREVSYPIENAEIMLTIKIRKPLDTICYPITLLQRKGVQRLNHFFRRGFHSLTLSFFGPSEDAEQVIQHIRAMVVMETTANAVANVVATFGWIISDSYHHKMRIFGHGEAYYWDLVKKK